MMAASRRWLRSDWALLALFLPGALAFGSSLGPLSWDGSYYLFRIVHEGAPPVFHDRWPALVLSVPAWIAHSLTGNLGLSRLVFGLTYALVPLLVMLAGWRLARRSAPGLVVWVALGATVFTLPLQFFAVSEALIATQLAWPLLVLVLAEPSVKRRAAGGLLALAITFLHPVTACLLGTFVVICLYRWKFVGVSQRYWCALFVACTALSVLWPRSDYETSMSAGERIGGAFGTAWGSPPLVVLVVLAAAMALFITRIGTERYRSFMLGLAVFMCGLVLSFWGATDKSWTEVLDYRFLIPLFSCPLLVLAVVDNERGHNASYRGIVALCGVAFSSVLLVQSVAWHQSLDDFEAAVGRSDGPCLEARDLVAEDGPVYRFWALNPLSVVMQDRDFSKAVVTPEACELWRTTGQLRLSPEPEPIGDGWFRPVQPS